MDIRRITAGTLALLLLGLAVTAAPRRADPKFAKDVEFALDELKKECGHFFREKDIDWKEVEREFAKAVRDVESPEDEWVLLCRLVARLKDGHAGVRVLPPAGKLEWKGPNWGDDRGPGMFWCGVDGKIYVKNAFSPAADSGVEPGMQIVEVDDEPVEKWIEAKTAERADFQGYSTPQQAFYATCHWGLGGDPGTTMKLTLRELDGKRKKATITRRRASTVPVGPAFAPKELKSIGRQSYGKTEKGFGYIHLRDVPGELPEQLDTMLAELADVPGLILDFRANGGGGCDHDAVLARFVPEGKKLMRAKASPIESAGPHPYGGPIVVIVDAGVRSAGETASGMFKEDGRAWMIGESATAGMSSQKKTIELPSGLFALYVSVASNKGRFNGGKGIEGIGVPPDEVVEYDPADLAKGVDTQIRRAEEILAGKPPMEPRFR